MGDPHGSGRLRGYRKKPWWILAIAASYLLVPVLCMLQCGLDLGFSPPLMAEVARSDFFLVESACAVSAAVAVLVVTRASLVYFAVLSLCTIGIRLQGLQPGAPGALLDLVLVAFWLSMTAILLGTTLRAPYLNPRLRWWAQPERMCFVSRSALRARGVWFPVVTLDLSAGGAFVKLDERLLPGPGEEVCGGGALPGAPERRKTDAAGAVMLSPEQLARARRHLSHFPARLGERVRLRMLAADPELAGDTTLESDVEVVWTAAASSPHRFGLGLRFVGRSRRERRLRERRLRRLRKPGLRVRE